MEGAEMNHKSDYEVESDIDLNPELGEVEV